MEHQVSTGTLLREVARLHTHLQRSCVTYCDGTTATQCSVLTELGRSGPITLIELSRRIGFDKSWTSRAVENLVQEGLVEKVPSQTDRRTVRLSLSTAGQQRLAELNLTLNALADQALERIPLEEHDSIHSALQRLQKALQELAEEAVQAAVPGDQGEISCTCD